MLAFAAMNVRQPGGGVCAHSPTISSLHLTDLGRAAGDHSELRIEAFEIQLAHDAVVPLLDQEHARARLELLP